MKLPIKEVVKSIPGLVGIRLEEEPAHIVLKEEGSFQLREYQPLILASVTEQGSYDEAMDRAFERLAGYIFGDNQQRSTLAMTTPVLQNNQKLDMTTPVMQTQSGSSWTMSFVLPSELTFETAPIPDDAGIKIHPRPTTKVATYRYSGTNTLEAMNEAKRELEIWIKKIGLNATGAISFAQYDQPFSLPFTKRNEAHIEVR